MEAKLIKIDRNGSRHYVGEVACDRCGGDGIYKWGAMINGERPQYAGTCYKCCGAGKVIEKWIERTPEYQAKLDAKRRAKWEAQQAEYAAENAKREAERAAREAEERAKREAEEAQKAISQHVGQVGDKVEFEGIYVRTGSWEQKAYAGYGMTTMFIHTFKDPDGNVFTWRTQRSFAFEGGESVNVKGTVKAHSEYKDEKQTELTRCKVTRA